MLRAPINEFALTTLSASPVLSVGLTMTPGNNTYGTYVQLISGASVTDDALELWIQLTGMAVSGVARDALFKIGIDPAGGTSYTDFIVDLSGAEAGASNTGTQLGGTIYRFLVRIRAGTSIAAAASVNNATVGTCAVFCWLKCRPSHGETIRVGSYVRTYGSTPASSSGTALTPGTSGKGSYVQVGTIAAGDAPWYWHIGVNINNAVGNNNPLSFDLALGDATNKRIVVADMQVQCNTGEVIHYWSFGAAALGVAGDNIYIRAAANGAPSTGWSAIAYGVGG